MKALLCTQCVDIRALDPNGAWTTCRCGACSARWEDSRTGKVRAKATHRHLLRIMGFNNTFLINGMNAHDDSCSQEADLEWRKLHDRSTDCPGYLFDKSVRDCWAVIFRVGETGDVKWEEEPKPQVKSEPPETGHTD